MTPSTREPAAPGAGDNGGQGAVRCPDPACAREFCVGDRQLGRTVSCPECGRLLTARPVALDGQLRGQEARVRRSHPDPCPTSPLVALADDVRSLWNVGSLFRTADGCGVGLLVLCGITGHPPRREIAKTALGAEAVVPWRYRADAVKALDELVREGYTPVAVETSPRAVPLDAIEWPSRVCLVVGNEVAGVTPAVRAACPVHVAIPMRGVKDSLNVAVAFGIAAHRAAAALLPEGRAAVPAPADPVR